MLYGTGKPKIQLRNADDSLNEELTFSYPEVIEPDFDLDEIKFKTQDGALMMYNRGWWMRADIHWPMLSDAEFRTLIRMMKRQFDFDTIEGKTRYIRLIPRVDNANEYYDGYITTPIKLLNKYHFITHGAKILFEGNKRLAQNEFLITPITDEYLTWPGTIQLGNLELTVHALPLDSTLPVTYEWRFSVGLPVVMTLEATYTDQGLSNLHTHEFIIDNFLSASESCGIQITAKQGGFSYTEIFSVWIGSAAP